MDLSKLNLLLGIVLIALGIAIWVTASQTLVIIFLVVLLIGGLNITGVLGSLVNRKKVD